jgi:ABC-type Fe3+-hydroxamate transport system substrate-binding protein
MDVVAVGGMRNAAAGALAVGALLLLTGCGQRSEPTGATVPLYPVTVEQSSAPAVVLASKPNHVVALTPQAASLVSSLLGRKVSPDKAGPSDELVVTTPEDLSSKARIKAPLYVAPDASIDDVERALAALGLLLDRPIRARQLIDGIESKRALVRTHLADAKPVTVFVDTGFFTTVSNHSLLGNLITEAGGHNVAGPGSHAEPFDVRRLVRLNPDFYLATSDSGTTLAELRHDPRTRRLKAVRSGRFAILASRVVQPSGEIGTELVAIARYLHPDAFR